MDQLLTPEETAERLAVSVATLSTWRNRHPELLPWIKVGGRAVRYAESDVEAFIEAGRRGGSA